MEGDILIKKGVTFIEIALGLAVVAVFVVSAIWYGFGGRRKAQVKRVVNDLVAVADASVSYYGEHGQWPQGIDDLRKGCLSKNVSKENPFGYGYFFNGTSQLLQVSTLVPTKLISKECITGAQIVIQENGEQDRVTVGVTVPNRQTCRLKYDKKYLYQE